MCQALLITNEQTAALIKFDLMICHHPSIDIRIYEVNDLI